MKIGISLTSHYQIKDTRLGARWMIERAEAAYGAGLDSLFLGDHHVVPAPYYQNIPMLGRLLGSWQGRLAGSLHLLPLWHPVLLAEQIATLANIHDAPYVLQCGLGYGKQQFDGMGVNEKFRPSSLEQSIACLRALWAGERVSLNGRWKFENASINPLPPEKIKIWIGAGAEIAIDRAARLGDAWLAEPNTTVNDAEMLLETYQRALQKHNKPQPEEICIRKDVFIAADEAEAEATLAAMGEYRGFKPGALLIGTAEQVAEQMQAYNKLGYNHIVVRNLHPEQNQSLASTQRLTHVRQILGLD